MTCGLEQAKPDWKAYTLGELDAQARRDAEAHAMSCPACQEEVANLRITLDAMATLREEEMPRRIAFVSDKIFEPAWPQKLAQVFLRPSFAAAAVIAAAILVHAFVRPAAPAPQGVAQLGSTQVDASAIEARVSAEVAKRVETQINTVLNTVLNNALNSAVTKAVADARKRDEEHTAQMLAASERRYGQSTELMTRQVTEMYALNTGLGVR
jgi:anti-sigma factor RsiW